MELSGVAIGARDARVPTDISRFRRGRGLAGLTTDP